MKPKLKPILTRFSPPCCVRCLTHRDAATAKFIYDQNVKIEHGVLHYGLKGPNYD